MKHNDRNLVRGLESGVWWNEAQEFNPIIPHYVAPVAKCVLFTNREALNHLPTFLD